jgi:hypothetical protein
MVSIHSPSTEEEDRLYWEAERPSVSRAHTATSSSFISPKHASTILETECGWAEDQTITSNHFLVSGWKRKSRKVDMYGRG